MWGVKVPLEDTTVWCTHAALTKTTRTYQTSSRQTSHCWTSSHTWLICLFAPHFLHPSSRYLLSSPKAETVARQPAQHNTPALHSVGPRGFNQRARVYAHLYTELMWWKKKGAMNSFRLIEADGKSPFSSQGSPLDLSVNMVLHSLGICGGAAKIKRERGKKWMIPYCWKIYAFNALQLG